MIRAFILILACTIFQGCASYQTTLTNSSGKQVNCNAVGFGIIGSLIATSQHSDCVEKMKAKGFGENHE